MKSSETICYKNVCFNCGEKLYGKPKREIGAVTMHTGICEECGKKETIVPASDWEYGHKDVVTSEDWD